MRRLFSFLLVLSMLLSLACTASAATPEAVESANALHDLGLFQGVGTNQDGTPNYDLDRSPNRMEAVTMLVRLLGKENEAKAGTWNTPFTDVAEWAKPYVGYAYANGLTSGTSAKAFSGQSLVSATQYLTFILRALGYDSSKDFQWNKAWLLSDQIGITSGQYGTNSSFSRGDVAIISNNALSANLKGQNTTLQESLGLIKKRLSFDALQGIWYSSDGTKQYEKIIKGSTIYDYSYDSSDGSYYYIVTSGQITDDENVIYENANLVERYTSGYGYLYCESDSILAKAYSGKATIPLITDTTMTYGKTTYKKVSFSTVSQKVRNALDYHKGDLTKDALSGIRAQLIIPHVGASNNSSATLIITNPLLNSITLDSAVYVNGYLCFVEAKIKSVELGGNGWKWQVPVYHGFQYDNGRSTIKSDMYLDNNSKAKFTIIYFGKKYIGECDTNGNVTWK